MMTHISGKVDSYSEKLLKNETLAFLDLFRCKTVFVLTHIFLNCQLLKGEGWQVRK